MRTVLGTGLELETGFLEEALLEEVFFEEDFEAVFEEVVEIAEEGFDDVVFEEDTPSELTSDVTEVLVCALSEGIDETCS